MSSSPNPFVVGTLLVLGFGTLWWVGKKTNGQPKKKKTVQQDVVIDIDRSAWEPNALLRKVPVNKTLRSEVLVDAPGLPTLEIDRNEMFQMPPGAPAPETEAKLLTLKAAEGGGYIQELEIYTGSVPGVVDLIVDSKRLKLLVAEEPV